MSHPRIADLVLLLAAFIWGAGFIAQRLGMDAVGPTFFTGARFAIGAAVVLPIAFLLDRRARTIGRTFAGWRTTLLTALPAGVLLLVGAQFQQIGLVEARAADGGFITGLYVIFVPIILLFAGRVAGPLTWAGTGLATIGLLVLGVQPGFTIMPAHLWLVACAVIWAMHVLLIGVIAHEDRSPRIEPVRFAFCQFAVVGVAGLVFAPAVETTTLASVRDALPALLFSGVIAVGVGFTLQVIAQSRVPATRAAIIMSLEAVFAAILGYLWLSETLGAKEVVGCVLMFAGIILSQLAPAPGRAGDAPASDDVERRTEGPGGAPLADVDIDVLLGDTGASNVDPDSSLASRSVTRPPDHAAPGVEESA